MHLAVIRDLVNWKGRVRWVVLCLAVHAKNRKASGTHIKSHIVSSTSLALHGSLNNAIRKDFLLQIFDSPLHMAT